MNVAERIFELYDRIEAMAGDLIHERERIEYLEEENEDLEHSIKQLTAELKAEKAIHKINEQALVSCERQLGMDENATILPSESVEDGRPNKCSKFAICINDAQKHNACFDCSDYRRFVPKGRCSTCKHYGEGERCEVEGPCCMHFDRWEPKNA